MGTDEARLKDILTDAIRYWERGRIVYNLVLTSLVAAICLKDLPAALGHVSFEAAQRLFILVVIANVLYCAAYIVDVAVQFSELRQTWCRWRWVLFVIGTIFASIHAHWITLGFLKGST